MFTDTNIKITTKAKTYLEAVVENNVVKVLPVYCFYLNIN